MKHRTMGFEKVRLAYDALQLPPGATAGMAVGAEIAPSYPVIIRAGLLGTVLLRGVDRSRASALSDEHRRWGQQGRVTVGLALLTGRAGRLFGQAGKGLGGFRESLGL